MVRRSTDYHQIPGDYQRTNHWDFVQIEIGICILQRTSDSIVNLFGRN